MNLFSRALLPSVVFFAILSCGVEQSRRTADVFDFTENQLLGRDLPAKTISLTFDDGPGERTEELVDYLYENNIRATFFVVGSNAKGKEALLQKIKARGHLLANHSQNHESMLKTKDPIDAVRATDNIIAPFTTGNMYLFRAPYGAWSGNIARVLNADGLTKYVGSVFWDIGGQSTARYSADWDCWGKGWSIPYCGEGYLNEIYDLNRGIVLMHDVHNKTVEMTKWMVPRLQNAGYQFARLDEVPNIAKQIIKAGGTPGYPQSFSN